MHYNMTGSGEKAIVFIHGFGGWGGLWQWQVEHFKSQAKVITVDLPGHGQTPWVPSGLLDMADGLRQVLDRENISRAHWVASSFGGLLALMLLETSPDRAATLSLIGAPPRFSAALSKFLRRLC